MPTVALALEEGCERKAGGGGSLADWLDADIPEADNLCGEVLSTSSKSLLYAPTGKGKTTFCLALAAAIAAGRDFLHWKGPGMPRRVLYIDGEMSQAMMQARLRDAVRRLGLRPKGLVVLSQDRQPEMRPLDTEEGQRWLDFYIEDHGPFDLIVFDNLGALTSGSLIGAEAWRAMKDWTQDLTKRCIGQLWVHHTGNDTSHAYGDSARLWGMDTVIKLSPIGNAETDIAFAVKFEKKRNCTPDNRADFATAQVQLVNDEWRTSEGSRPIERKELIRAALLEEPPAVCWETRLRESELAARLAGDDSDEAARWLKALKNCHAKPTYNGLCECRDGKWGWFAKDAPE